jgi:hypothetical protein
VSTMSGDPTLYGRLLFSSGAESGVTETTTAGVDTWKLGFRYTGRLPSHRFPLGHYQCVWLPQHALVTMEGHPLPDRLCPPGMLEAAHHDARETLGALCVSAEPTRVYRLDSTVQLDLGGSKALDVLRGMAAVAVGVPGIKPGVIGKPVETVNLQCADAAYAVSSPLCTSLDGEQAHHCRWLARNRRAAR